MKINDYLINDVFFILLLCCRKSCISPNPESLTVVDGAIFVIVFCKKKWEVVSDKPPVIYIVPAVALAWISSLWEFKFESEQLILPLILHYMLVKWIIKHFIEF